MKRLQPIQYLELNNSHGGEIRQAVMQRTADRNESEVKIMKLGNILSVMNENKNMYIWDDGEIIASYDSRNSIPFELNDRLVEMVDCENNEFHIYLECE